MSHEISTEKRGHGGWILLHRHGALNALSMAMLEFIHEALDATQSDESVGFVVVDSLNPKAFCAGGDIRAAYDHRSDLAYVTRYFELEYALNERIAHFSKPYISLIDGLCLGGGMGLSCHGSFRIMSDRAQMAMPETAIGFFPDVGAGAFLNRCPGFLGRYLGLTGARVHMSDAVFLRLATHGLHHSHFDGLRAFLDQVHGHSVAHQLQVWLDEHASPMEPGPIQIHRGLLDTCFSHDSMEEIIAALQAHQDVDFIRETLDLLLLRSPTSLKVTLAYLKACHALPVADVLALDRTVAGHYCRGHEFYEGIRAMVVDKDKSPLWNPASLNEVSEEMVQGYFNTQSHF